MAFAEDVPGGGRSLSALLCVYIEIAINTPTHAVLLIGYGTLPNNKKYWILKNSWSNTWGYKGFFAIEWVTSPIGVKNNVGQLKSGPTALFDDITYISTENLKKILLNIEVMEKFGENPNEHEMDLQNKRHTPYASAVASIMHILAMRQLVPW